MKRLVLVLLTLVLFIIFASGCTGREAVTGEPGVATGTPAAASEPVTGVQEEATDTPAAAATEDPYSDFKAFWGDFREAVLSRDMTEIKKYVYLPLETRGPLDSDPTIAYDENKFDAVFSAFLDDDMNYVETNLVFIEQKGTISVTEWDMDSGGAGFDVTMFGDNKASIGNMEFEKEGGKWGLTFLYFSSLDYEEYD